MERYREYTSSGTVQLERWTMLASGVAQIDTLTVDGGQAIVQPEPTIRFQYRDHLGSSTVEANESGQVISYEEYYAYGSSAYRASAPGTDLSLKRYRFTDKEKDDETGLYYFGVRYYAAWLGRWTSADPGGFVDGLNLYRYVRNNPVNGVDPDGYATQGDLGDPPPINPAGQPVELSDGAIINAVYNGNSKTLPSGTIIHSTAGSIRQYQEPTSGGGWITYTATYDASGDFLYYGEGPEELDADAILLERIKVADQEKFMAMYYAGLEKSSMPFLYATITLVGGATAVNVLSLSVSLGVGTAIVRGGTSMVAGLGRLSGTATFSSRVAASLAPKLSLNAAKGFVYNGIAQGSINAGFDFVGKFAAYGGDFSQAINNLDLADVGVGFVTGGFTNKFSMFGSFYNVVGGSLIDYNLNEGYKTFGSFFGGQKKDPWKVTGDMIFNSIGLGLEFNVLLRETWSVSKQAWVLPQTNFNLFSKTVSITYGAGFGSTYNEIFNNNKPRVVEEYGFQGTKRR